VVVGGFIFAVGVPWVLVQLQLRQDNLDHRLIQAVKNLDAPAVDRLLVEGASANVRYTDSPPPSLSALLARQVSRLQHQPDGQPDEEQKTLLPQILDHLNLGGQEKVYDTIAVMLIRHGADINTRDRSERTPLHTAASLGLHQTVRLLLSRGLDVNARSDIGVTPLMFADDESAELLVKRGADIHVIARGYTAVMTTLGRHHLKATTLLIQHGADVHVIDPKGHSTLYSAYDVTIHGPEQAAIIRLLKDHGARLNKLDNEALASRKTK
jgi:ankyrin repeat protein